MKSARFFGWKKAIDMIVRDYIITSHASLTQLHKTEQFVMNTRV